MQTTGVFDIEKLPEHVFSLGDSLFLTVAEFNKEVSVHIRKYQTYGTKHYPTREGVTLKTGWAQSLFGVKDVPTTEQQLAYQLQGLEVHSTDFEVFRITRTRLSKIGIVFSSCVELSHSQWKTAINQWENISTALVNCVYGAVDFLTVFTSVYADLSLPDTLPCSLDTSLGVECLRDTFKQAFKRCILFNTELKEPYSIAEEKCGNRLEHFNRSVLSIPPTDIAMFFHDDIWQNEPYLCLRIADYMTQSFLQNLDFKEYIVNLRQELCPKDACEFFS